MKKNKMVAVLLIMILALSTLFTGCSSNGSGSKDPQTGNETTDNTSDNDDVKKVKIGVILYNYTDIQGKEIKNYCDNYLAKEFPVTFEYQTATSGDDSAHIAAVDSLISTGCNAIMTGYDTLIGESMEKCEEAGVYYGILFGEAKNESNKDGKYNEWGNWGNQEQSDLYYSDYFLGGLYQFGADAGYELGKTYGEAVVNAGVKKVGAISFPAYAFSDAITICQGFTEVLTAAGVEICPDTKTNGLPAEAGFVSVGDDTKAYIANYPDMDGIFGLSSGMDMVLPAINEVGRLWNSQDKAGAMKIATLGYNESSAKYLEEGTLMIGGTNNYVQSVAYLFTLMFDAVNGYNMKTTDGSNFQYNAAINYPTFTNMDELKDMETYMITTVHNDFSKCSVTSDEIKSVLKAYGGSGDWNELSTIVSRSIEEIKEIR